MNISLLSQAVGTSTNPLENAQEQIKEAETFFNKMINAFVGYLPTLIAAAIILIVGIVISKLVLKMMSRGMKHDVIDKTVSRFIIHWSEYCFMRCSLLLFLPFSAFR